jgi:hypothetical protein
MRFRVPGLTRKVYQSSGAKLGEKILSLHEHLCSRSEEVSFLLGKIAAMHKVIVFAILGLEQYRLFVFG